MDRNSIIGIVLIAGLFLVWSYLNTPSKEEQAREKFRIDSLNQVRLDEERERQIRQEIEEELAAKEEAQIDPAELAAQEDAELKAVHGIFASTVKGEQKFYTLENELISLKISTKGGRPYSVQLKDYQTYDSLPLLLFDGDSTVFGLDLLHNNRPKNSNDLFFVADTDQEHTLVEGSEKSISFRLPIQDGTYLEYVYSLAPGKYEVGLQMNMVGMRELVQARSSQMDLIWEIYSPQQEKGWKNESQYTTAYFKHFQDDVEFLNARSNKDQQEPIPTELEWIAYKDQFFSSVLMANDRFNNATIETVQMPENGKYIKQFKSKLGIPYNGLQEDRMDMAFYFGPNKFKLLKKEYGDKELHNLVTVGRSIIKWINQGIIINIFNWLNKHIANYGIIILLLTLIIKLGLLPLTYRSFLSQAKMKVLKPQIDEINNKIPKEKAMERQQATMALYKKVGVSPLGGCLPMVLQMPILFAMFRFFPTSIELRQESFLWATDLSTYDSIIEWSAQIPVISKFYGNHVSLFTLLMTITTILSMKTSGSTAASNQQMPGMKTMMYFMPVMFMFVLNNFSAGLTYYYFLANLITFGQNMLFKQFVDEKQLLKKLEAKKAKPKKKSNFQKRMEDMAKQRGHKPPKRR